MPDEKNCESKLELQLEQSCVNIAINIALLPIALME